MSRAFFVVVLTCFYLCVAGKMSKPKMRRNLQEKNEISKRIQINNFSAQNRQLRFSAEVTHEGHLRSVVTVDGGCRLIVQAFGESQGNLTKCGAIEGLTVRRLIDRPSC